MANFKRKKCKRTVKCTMCTQNRWKGNSKDRYSVNYLRKIQKLPETD